VKELGDKAAKVLLILGFLGLPLLAVPHLPHKVPILRPRECMEVDLLEDILISIPTLESLDSHNNVLIRFELFLK
jgi:hypothetical protein